VDEDKMKKRLISAVLCFLVPHIFVAVVGAAKDLPDISAEAAILYDWNSGRVLYARKPHLPKPMASTTKIMTAILALERGNLQDRVITSPVAAHVEGSSIWLEEGEEKTLEELLFGLMLYSGNDAALAIAEHLSGSGEKFAEEMTARARELGAENTVFKNPHGLHHPEHQTTAYDFALIAAHAMGMKEFRRIITTPHVTISWPGHPWDRFLYNQNKLLDSYPGAEGIKTGWTTPAGRCFVGSAERSGRRLITVVLNAPNMWEDTIALFDYGFDNFTYHTLVEKNQYLKSAPVLGGVSGKIEVVAADNFYYPFAATEKKTLLTGSRSKNHLRLP
jgi:D-alanyl-D-alanine carboxypeptidase (penicillin-binding protein 5/6)